MAARADMRSGTTAEAPIDDRFDAGAEFDRQLRALLDKGYPRAAGMTTSGFVAQLEPLRAGVLRRGRRRGAAMTAPAVPFLVVVTKRLVPAERSMPLTDLGGRPGFVSPDTADIHRFEPIDAVQLPAGNAYVGFDVERGDEFRGVTPDGALAAITARDRTPLTVDEGIALVTLFPQSLQKNHCFSLVASRCGDRRVPALWISKAAPKLGWCWAGNPHTWLGSASCGGRWGAEIRPAHR
jgi:hypothetical protein